MPRRPPGLRRPLLRASYLIGARIVRALPPGLRYRLAGAGGAAWYWASRGQRRNAWRNYGAVLGLAPDDARVRRTARHAFQQYGQTLADFVLLGVLSREQVLERVSVSGLHHVQEALALGRGCIMAVPHMGSWDIGGAYAGALGLPVAAVAERFPGSLDRAVVEARAEVGLEVIPMGHASVGAIRGHLRANHLVALACDLPQGPGVEVRFFGCRVGVPGGPAAFACKTGAPIVPASVERVAPGRYHIQVEPALQLRPEDCAGRAGQARIMQRVIEVFERHIRARPEQWYAFRPLLVDPF